MPKFMMLGDVLDTVVQQASSTSTGSTITAPADIQGGDLLVIHDFALSTATPTSVVPSGFGSQIDTSYNNGTTGGRSIASFKLADGSEASAVITGMNATTMRKALLVFRGNAPASAISVLDTGADANNIALAAQTVTASGGVVPLVVLGFYASDCATTGAVSPRTMSPAKDGEVTSDSVAQYLAWKIYNSSPADVTVGGLDDEGSRNFLQSCYVQMS